MATTAVRESSNSDMFIDNINRNTGINVNIISASKESEYIYQGLSQIIANTNEPVQENEEWAIIEIGSGNLEITLLEGNCILYVRSLPLGILKNKQIFLREINNPEENFLNYLKVTITHELQNLKRSIPANKIKRLFALGSEVNYLPALLTSEETELPLMKKTQFKRFYSRIKNFSEEELYHKIKIPHDMTETFIPACLILINILDFFNCKEFIIPKISLADGIINSHYYARENKDQMKNLEKQLKLNVLNFGRSLKFDEKHALKVTDLALKIFDQTKEIHMLGDLERCYLLVACLLHDIGSCISFRAHHKHSLYIIKSLHFFSLNTDEINIIANTARYHRKSAPKNSHADFTALNQKDRMTVYKLSAILRIADSLDNTHLQLIEDIKIHVQKERIIIYAYVSEKFFTELFSFRYKKELFEEFFGLPINLEKIRINKNRT